MATYNWSIKPGVQNRYGFSVPGNANDFTRQPTVSYIALFGNDVTGNGSRMYPYRTIAKARSVAMNEGSSAFIIASGVYRQDTPIGDIKMFADGDVFFDNSVIGSEGYLNMQSFGIKHLDFHGNVYDMYNAVYSQVSGNMAIYLNASGQQKQYSIFQTTDTITVFGNNIIGLSRQGNHTLLNAKVLFNGNPNYGTFFNPIYFSIFSNCQISFQYEPILDYCLFHNCSFRHGNAGAYTPINTKEELQAFISAVYPNNLGFKKIEVADPKFNNPDIGDYSLAFDSPAKNLSYFGTFVGAKSIGYPIKARLNEQSGDFDFSTKSNLTISDNSIVLTNPTLDASIESKVKANIIARELAEAPIYGFNADRNGQYIDSIPDLAVNTIPPTEALALGTPYQVEQSAITYDGVIYQPGDRFTTGSAITAFSSIGGGVCREIMEAPQRHTIMARFSNGGDEVIAGSPLIVGNWYYVKGTISYEGVDYTDEAFKAVNTNAFTGAGIVVIAMSDELYQHYEPGVKFTSNNQGDVRTGTILRGNGDPEYERGVNKEFPINSRFIQVKYIIRVNNLKP